MKRVKSRQDKDDQDRAYAIGYGKPPATSRFMPGQSGNAKGRPKGHKNLKTLIRQAMTAKISIQEGSSSRQVSKLEGVVLRQLQSALKGDDRSAMAVMKIATQLGILDDAAEANSEPTLSASEQKMVNELVLQRTKRRRSKSRR